MLLTRAESFAASQRPDLIGAGRQARADPIFPVDYLCGGIQ
jgi:hypothetical protein